MRTRPILKEWTSWTGLHCVADIDATMAMLAESCPEDQENDAYWQAVDLLDKNKDISYEELSKAVTADHGFLNMGCVLKSGKGRAFWECKDKELCIRWAIIDSNYKSDKQINYYNQQ